MRKALSMKQYIKASVWTRKFLSEFCLEVLQLNLILTFYRFVRFKRFSGIKIYKIFDTLLLNPLFRFFTSLPAIYDK